MTNPFADTEYGKLSVFCRRTMDLVIANQSTLELADVFYDDQQQIPRTPTACVVPDEKRRMLQGVPRRTENTFSLYVLLYISDLNSSTGSNAEEALTLAESVEDLLHAEPTLDGLLVHSFCESVEPGYRTRGNTRFRACRIKYVGINKTILGM